VPESVTDMVQNTLTLAQLGWRPYFQQQIGLEQWENPVARVITQHRNRLELLGEAGELGLGLHPGMPAGSKVAEQLIAANVDTLFIVTSLNEDFNLSRIERYLSLAYEAQTEPVVILSNADLCDDVESLRSKVQVLENQP
jgi:ribosome biogenesis GTPase